MAAIATQGRRSWLPYATGELVRRWDRVFTRDAHDRLTLSGRTTLIAVVLISLSVSILWLGPRHADDLASGSSAVVVQGSGAVLCGELAGEADGTVRLRRAGDEDPVILREVTSVVPVDGC